MKSFKLFVLVAMFVAAPIVTASPASLSEQARFHSIALRNNMQASNAILAKYKTKVSSECYQRLAVMQRKMRNDYVSIGGQLPLNFPAFAPDSAERVGYLAAMHEQGNRELSLFQDLAVKNCQL